MIYLPLMGSTLLAVLWGICYFLFIPLPEKKRKDLLIRGFHFLYFFSTIALYFLCLIGNLYYPEAQHFDLKVLSSEIIIPLDFSFSAVQIGFLLLGQILCGIVGKFSYNYLFLERRKSKFFFYLFLFLTAYQLIVVAANLNLILMGWEFLGLSSILLIGFFNDRHRPLESSLKVFFIYRIADLFLIFALLITHHHLQSTAIADLAKMDDSHLYIVLVCLILAAFTKASLFPFRPWLPMAMEGPTPSSAIFYGGLSVHAGVILLLKIYPLIQLPDMLPVRIFFIIYCALGLFRSAYRLKNVNDYKSIQAHLTLQQLTLIMVELLLGWKEFALSHLFLHAIYRTAQFLQTPQLFLDYLNFKRRYGYRTLISNFLSPLYYKINSKLDLAIASLEKIKNWPKEKMEWLHGHLIVPTSLKVGLIFLLIFTLTHSWGEYLNHLPVAISSTSQIILILLSLGFTLFSVERSTAKEKLSALFLGQYFFFSLFLFLETTHLTHILFFTLISLALIYFSLDSIYSFRGIQKYTPNLKYYHGLSHYFPGLAHWHFFFILCAIGFPVCHLFLTFEALWEHLLNQSWIFALAYGISSVIMGYQLLAIHLRLFYGPANPLLSLCQSSKKKYFSLTLTGAGLGLMTLYFGLF